MHSPPLIHNGQDSPSPKSLATLSTTYTLLHLDVLYPQIVRDSWLVLSIPEYQSCIESKSQSKIRATPTLTGKTTRLTQRGEFLLEHCITTKPQRDGGVRKQCEELTLVETPITADFKAEIPLRVDRKSGRTRAARSNAGMVGAAPP